MPGIPLGFNAGFSRGLASVLQQHRASELDREREDRGRQDRLAEIMLGAALPRAERLEDAIGLVQQLHPDLFKGADGKMNLEILRRGVPQAAAQALGGDYIQDGQGGLVDAGTRPATSPAPGGVPRVGPVASAGLGMPAEASPPAPGGVPLIGPIGNLVTPSQGPPERAAVPPPVGTVAPSAFLTLSEMEQRKYAAPLLAQVSPQVEAARRSLAQRIGLDEQETQYFVTEGRLSRPYSSAASGMQSIAGELPDGTPVFGVFNRQTGTYNDPQTGEPIPGFRPRTSTGSRTLGGDREALAIEMFKKPASQLSSEQMAAVNATLPEYLEKLSHGRGMGSGTARNKTLLDKPFTVDENAQLQTPEGTTPRDVMGQVPMTSKQQETRQALTTLTTKLPALEALISKVIPDYGEGIVARARSSGEMKYKSAAGDPALTQLRALAKSMAGEVSRVIQGQTGVLSDQDTQRANAILTDTDSWFSDTRAQALAKVAVMKEMIDKINAAIPNPQATGVQGRQPRVTVTPQAAPTPTPTATPKPKVTNAAPAAQKVGNAWVIP